MYRDPHAPERRGRVLRALGGTGLLLLYLATATPMAAALTALLAAADADHCVAIRQTARGLQVVLRHACPNSPAHRHGMVARVLTLFAQRTTPAQMDHIILFGATDTVRESPPASVEPGSCAALLDAFTSGETRTYVARLHRCPATFPRPPPVQDGVLLHLRSIVLLV
jgi:hypothetical protein